MSYGGYAKSALKYTLIKNFEANLGLTGNNTFTSTIDGGPQSGFLASYTSNVDWLGHTFPRVALIKVGIEFNPEETGAAAAPEYAFGDDPNAPQDTPGYYTICSNDLTVGAPGILDANGFVNYTFNANDNPTVPVNWIESNSMWQNFGPTLVGVKASFALFGSVFDMVNGVDGFKLQELSENLPPSSIGSSTPYNKYYKKYQASNSAYAVALTGNDYDGGSWMNHNQGPYWENAINTPFSEWTGSAFTTMDAPLQGTLNSLAAIESIMMIDTVGRTSINPASDGENGRLGFNHVYGLQGNEVLVFIRFKQSSTNTISAINNQDIEFLVELGGRPKWFPTGPSEQSAGGFLDGGGQSQWTKSIPTSSTGSVKLSYKDDNDTDIKITPTTSWNLRETPRTIRDVSNSAKNNVSSFSITGPCLLRKSKSIAQIKMTAPEGKYFSSKPYLKTSSGDNIKLKFKSQTKALDTNNKPTLVTYYCLEVIYKSKYKNILKNSMSTELVFKVDTIPTVTTEIRRVEFGNIYLKDTGELREITIYGTPNAVFGIAINESFEEIETFEGETVSTFSKINDVSILTPRSNNTTAYNYGQELKVLTGTIGSSGKYSFLQKFPSNVINRTRIDGTKSSATVIDFVDIAANKVGDRMYGKGIHKTFPTKLTTKTSSTRSTFNRAMSVANNADIFFKRSRFYSIDLIPELCSTLSSSVPTTETTHRLFQFFDPIFTMKHSIAGTNYTITHNNSTTTSLGSGAELELEYTGKSFSKNVLKNKNNLGMGSYLGKRVQTVSMLLDLVDASHTFDGVTIPKFSNIDQAKSTWTNSVTNDNGGTEVNVWGFTHSAVGANTITLTYYFEIKKFGIKDITMELDLDSILTIGT